MDHTSNTIYVAFKVKETKQEFLKDASVIIWTTTPWTIPANKALAFNNKIEYSVLEISELDNFKEKNINDQISINEKEISIKKFKGDKLFYSSKFSTYWSKVFFTKQKNKSKLSIRESDKETEVASFLHADLKESLYNRITNQIILFRK